ncbi:Spo0B domain-containing protein [Thalassobacillus hwangdonensis]|uniref:Spo0B domain-containing protein n=1 Tax=Thalassobacillus hwangdonensis TaxID=546108 RepID=A0ABW3KZC2_9BACI
MQVNEVIQLLRHKRHDWMNQLQLIQGYTTMGKTEKVHATIQKTIETSQEEQKLMNLNVPYLTLWLLSFNWSHENHRLEFKIDMESQDLSYKDLTLLAYCEETIRILESQSDPESLYEGTLVIYKQQPSNVEVSMVFSGNYANTENIIGELEQLEFLTAAKLEDADHQQQLSMKLNVEIKR